MASIAGHDAYSEHARTSAAARTIPCVEDLSSEDNP